MGHPGLFVYFRSFSKKLQNKNVDLSGLELGSLE